MSSLNDADFSILIFKGVYVKGLFCYVFLKNKVLPNNSTFES